MTGVGRLGKGREMGEGGSNEREKKGDGGWEEGDEGEDVVTSVSHMENM